MWREPFGVMLRPLETLRCILIAGWAMASASSLTVELPASGPLIPDCGGLSPEILSSQQAVELSVHQIENCAYYTDIASSLPSLSKVEGWKPEQARAFVSKLFHSGYQVLDGQSLAALGSLVTGFNRSILESVPAGAVLEAVKDPSFAKHLERVSSVVKVAFVEKLIAAVDGGSDLVKYVPAGLVPCIPASLLGSGELLDIQDLNGKPWTSEQAAMFFDGVIKKTSDFNSLSPSILHGFTCATAAWMDDERVQRLAKAVKQKNVRLRGDQLSCLAGRLMLSRIPKDFDDYPEDVFLFLRDNPTNETPPRLTPTALGRSRKPSPAECAEAGSCEEYVSRVGKANLDLLEKGSPERAQLLSEGLACLNITGVEVSKEDAEILGHLVCDLGADFITASGKSLLKELTQCQSFTPDQIKAIQAVLSSGDTPFGPPSTWSSSTLDELSGLIHIFDHSILQNIPKDILIPWLKQYVERSHLPREKLAHIVKNLQPSRRKRDTAECPPDQTITEEMLNDKLMPIYYSPEELRSCLKGQKLVDSLPTISSYAFTYDQLVALKENLDKEFPGGYPPWLLPNMGAFLVLTSDEDIKKWNYTSPDTLAALLDMSPSDDQARLLIQQYVDSGGQLNSSALNAVGPRHICLLTKDQFNRIDERAIKTASSFDPSKCSQAMLDNLYPKAKRAFSDRHNEFPAYYNLIKPYLRGAPGEDLKALSKSGVNMDIETFSALKNDAVVGLTIDEVKGLLGINLKQLTSHQSQPVIRGWIHKQQQSDLDSLGLGLRGGVPNGYIVLTRASRRKKRGALAFEGI